PEQLLVGECANLPGFALPDQGGLVLAPGLDVPVEAVVREIDLAAKEPLRPGTVPLEDLVPLLEPVQLGGDPSPKSLLIFDRLTVDALVVFETFDVGLAAELFRTFKLPLLLQDGIDVSNDFW